ncbi:MAG TPA: L,D-transpeptidase [Caulobacteraceae bacterium]|jgi:lipoprotein-anchoring transpeptidase ErfK/SrfK|nr:L,D-transpeptidase [Caulobacteraceae bacterium]
MFRVTLLGLSVAVLAACSNDQPAQPAAKPQAAATPPPAPAAPQPANAAIIPSVGAAAYDPAVNAPPSAKAGPSPVLIKAEVLLDRAHFSPGVIDGKFGENVHNAIAAFEAAHGMNPDGQLTPAVWQTLSADKRPVLQNYVIAPQDVQGPFIGSLPAKFPAQAKLPYMGFLSPTQAIAEKFHMGEALLKSLNPGVDFSKPGTTIVVAAPDTTDLPEPVARVEVDKAHAAVRAYDASGRLIADYPATVGSTDKPSPSGDLKVARIDWNPTYHYDPKQLHFAHVNHAFSIKPGPNNPVGVVWIALSKPTYGIHGAPAPQNIGKTASHGCVRLTNWDAVQLARAVTKGVEVVFLNQRPGTRSMARNDLSPRRKAAARPAHVYDRPASPDQDTPPDTGADDGPPNDAAPPPPAPPPPDEPHR